MKVAGVVVLYHPDENVLENIKTYIDDIDLLFAVDNSDKKNIKIVESLKKDCRIQYVDNHGNKGIAAALNAAAVRALKGGYEYLLTMDQDSRAADDMLEKLFHYIEQHAAEKLGIVSAYHRKVTEKNCYYLKPYEPMMVVMTSGNLLNLMAYRKTGKFIEKLFIDHVDNEYCLRLHRNGYKIIRVNDATLYHNLGQNVRIAGMDKTLHNEVRLYYILRNSLYLWEKYQKEFPEYVAVSRNEVFTMIRGNLLYGKHKLARIKNLLRAVYDYKRGHFGKIN